MKDLEKEVQKQIELRIIYRKRMERTQDYLRQCLQIAQDNGLLELMLHDNGDHRLTPINACSPKMPTAVHQPLDLSVIINHAENNGWYIHPQEVKENILHQWMVHSDDYE